jgi:transposase
MMSGPLSKDLRERVIRAIDGGLSRRAAAAKFDVSVSSAIRWYQRYQQNGSVEARRMGGDRLSHRIEVHAQEILSWVDDNKDITIKEIRAKLTDAGETFSHGAVWRLLKRHNYTVKKRQATRLSKTGPT